MSFHFCFLSTIFLVQLFQRVPLIMANNLCFFPPILSFRVRIIFSSFFFNSRIESRYVLCHSLGFPETKDYGKSLYAFLLVSKISGNRRKRDSWIWMWKRKKEFAMDCTTVSY